MQEKKGPPEDSTELEYLQTLDDKGLYQWVVEARQQQLGREEYKRRSVLAQQLMLINKSVGAATEWAQAITTHANELRGAPDDEEVAFFLKHRDKLRDPDADPMDVLAKIREEKLDRMEAVLEGLPKSITKEVTDNGPNKEDLN